jgi:hypothetical protein
MRGFGKSADFETCSACRDETQTQKSGFECELEGEAAGDGVTLHGLTGVCENVSMQLGGQRVISSTWSCLCKRMFNTCVDRIRFMLYL